MKQIIKLASQRSSHPILKTICVKAGKAIATDLDNYITYPTIESEGVYSPEAANVGIWQDVGLPLSDFPEGLELGEQLAAASIPADQLAWVAVAQSTESVRYYLNGICFDKYGAVATDGHRLHRVELEAPNFGDSKLILPSSAVKLILACHKEEKSKEPIFIRFYESRYDCDVGKYHIAGKLVDGTFPDYHRVIPNTEFETVYKHAEFKGMAKEVAALHKANGGGRSSKPVKLGNGVMSLRAGSFSKDFPVSIALKGIEIGFNFTLLEDIGIDGVFHYNKDAAGPIKVTQGNRTAVLMPLRV